MDNLSIFLFAIAGISTLVGAFYLMISAANSKPVRDYNAGRLSGEWTTEVTKRVHPEMEGVTEQEELLGFQIDEALGAVILNNEEPGKDEPFLLDPAFFEDDGE